MGFTRRAAANGMQHYIFAALWQLLPQALVYGVGIALPGATPFTALFVMRGTSKRCDVMSFIQ